MEDRDLIRDAYLSGYEQALFNRELGPEAFYAEWQHAGYPPPALPLSKPYSEEDRLAEARQKAEDLMYQLYPDEETVYPSGSQYVLIQRIALGYEDSHPFVEAFLK